MTKIESARIIVEQKGRCPVTLKCKTCFTKNGVCGGVENRLALAEAYIKRHESKSKKKDHILDTTKKVEEPKPIKTVGIDNSDVTLALTAQYEPTPLEIAKMIRDNGYVCLYIWDCTRQCPISNSKTGPLDCSINRKQLIDDYISANEPKPEPMKKWVKCLSDLDGNLYVTVGKIYEVMQEDEYVYRIIDDGDVLITVYKSHFQLVEEPCEPLASGMCSNPFDYCDKDCPVNSEIPQPVKLPDFVYSASKNGVGFIDTKNRTFNTNDKGELLINDKPCFATPEEALQVAKKLWNGDGK